jgi:hypothetical protein
MLLGLRTAIHLTPDIVAGKHWVGNFKLPHGFKK